MDFLRASRERRYKLAINDPKPVASPDVMWTSAAQGATIGLFLLAVGAFLYFAKAIVLPILAALLIGMTLTPLVNRAAGHGISPAVSAIALAVALIAAVGLGATLLAAPVSEWIGRAPEIGATIKQKLYVLDQPLAALHNLRESLMPAGGTAVTVAPGQMEVVAPVVAFLTPAAVQALVFVGTLIFFLIGQQDFRRRIVMLFADHEAKLRFLRIVNDIEHNLNSYLGVLSIINVVLGMIVGVGAWFFGYPNPIVFGLLAAILNYLPYVGPGLMTLILFGVGLVTFPSLGQAVMAPLCFVALTTVEGHFITPAIMGRRLTLSPLMVFMALAFWTWLWGPMGAFLAVPLSIVALVTMHHVLPTEDAKLPG